MYELHFALTDRPFRLQPDPDVLFWSDAHREAARFLSEAGERPSRPGKEVHVLTGEIGAGKTTLILNVLAKSPPDLTIALVSNLVPHCQDLLPALARALPFGITVGIGPELALMAMLVDQQAAGRAVLFIIDEAQELDPPALESLRAFLEAAQRAGLSNVRVILSGQPELARHLTAPLNVAFAARIARMMHLPRLSAEDTQAYVRHRLTAAGATPDLFTDGAVALIHDRAAGVPRMVNLIADQAMVAAYGANLHRIDEALLRRSLAQSGAPLLREAAAAPVTAPAPSSPPAAPASATPPVPRSPPAASPFDGRLRERMRAQTDPSVTVAPPPPASPPPPAPVPATPVAVARPPPLVAAPDAWAPLPEAPVRRRRRSRRWAGVVMIAAAAGAGGWWWSARGPDMVPRTAAPVASAPRAPAAASPVPAAPVPPSVSAAPTPASSAASAPVPPPASIAAARALPDGPPEVLLREAARLAVDDPAGGALGLMLAALAGSAKATDFVAEMAATGDGLPANPDLARLWRGETVTPTMPVTRPVPLLARRTGADRGDLVWAIGEGVPGQLVELRSAGRTIVAAAETRLGAVRIRMPAGAVEWRVTSLPPDGGAAGALTSDWVPLAP